MWAYPIKLRKDSNGTYLVTCPDLPEVATFGDTIADACKHALDAIEEAIAARMAERSFIPDPGKSKSRYRVGLPVQAVAKILLYRTMIGRGVSKNALARRLHWHRPQVDRLLNLRHATRLDTIEEAFGVLGKKITLRIEESSAPR